jgi:hypothetical protein
MLSEYLMLLLPLGIIVAILFALRRGVIKREAEFKKIGWPLLSYKPSLYPFVAPINLEVRLNLVEITFWSRTIAIFRIDEVWDLLRDNLLSESTLLFHPELAIKVKEAEAAKRRSELLK